MSWLRVLTEERWRTSIWSIIDNLRSFVSARKQERVRVAAAWLCLLAVVLLYAPMAGAAWSTRGTMNCCAGGLCPMAAHHHHRQRGTSAKDPTPMNCGHEMGGPSSAISSCMCSCKIPARTALLPGAFLLPPANDALVSDELSQPARMANSLEISRFVQPLSPPPRFAAQAV